MKRIRCLLLVSFLLPFTTHAQQPSENLMYSSGRIYVVVAVLLIILLGLLLYLIRIEKKLKKLEKED